MAKLEKLITLVLFAFFLPFPASAADATKLLPPEQAFRLSVKATAPDKTTATWTIADGYYLYRSKFRFASKAPDIGLGDAVLPAGEIKHDEFFGEMEIYRGTIDVEIPLRREDNGQGPLPLEITSQGCADAGVCFPPQKNTLTVALPAVAAIAAAEPGSLGKLAESMKELGLNLFQEELLPPDQAFRFSAEAVDGARVRVAWQIAGGYFLYREKFKFSLAEAAAVQIGDYAIPAGIPKYDEAFGQVEIFHNGVDFDLPLIRGNPNPTRITLTAHYQGCADRGVCYPPMQKTVVLELPAVTAAAMPAPAAKPEPPPLSEQDNIAAGLQGGSLWLAILSFFGFGLLLSFTPCMFPMIPILSGIIVGRGHRITTRRAFMLSLSYVTASAAMYTLFGILAALFGSNLQATFQNPWVIGAFSGLFVLLALSMFGFYHLEVPKALQTKLHDESERHRDGTLSGAAIMGALSALIVGPCVAAPLAGALIYIGQTGDALLGGLALFSLGMGMGFPLLLLGASAGKLLPKAGTWMNAVKAVFGVLMLAVAVWLLDRILPPAITMALWAMLLIIPAIYMSAADALPRDASGWRKLWKGIGIIMLTYGILLIIGVTTGNTNPLKPLQGFSLATRTDAGGKETISFRRVRTLDDLDNTLREAGAGGRWVMLDFYADWCISCKEMEHYTFTDPEVKNALADFILVQADVTENSAVDQALLKRFGLIGPPAILFFGPDMRERTAFRVIGYKNADSFTAHIRQVVL